MIPYDARQPLISLHIPKTAGSSFRLVLEQWFGDRLHLHYPAWDIPIGNAPLEAGVCIHGHFNIDKRLGVRECYPTANQFITVMRDPFDRMVSLWGHLRHEQAEGTNTVLDGVTSFDQWFGIHKEAAQRNPAAGFLRNFPEPVTAESAPTVFDSFVAVGVTERMQETVDLLSRTLGKPPILIGRENIGRSKGAEFSSYRSTHEQAFALEHEVYAVATKVFNDRLRAG